MFTKKNEPDKMIYYLKGSYMKKHKKGFWVGIGATILGVSCLVGIYFYLSRPAEYYIDQANLTLESASQENAKEKVSQAMDYLDTGIRKHPNRLDMRFAKTFLCQMLQDVTCMKNEIISTIKASQHNNNQWQWLKGETQDNKYMLDVIMSYQRTLFDAEQDEAVAEIASEILKYYPDYVPAINTLALTHIMQNEFDQAQELLERALALSPDDQIVINNMKEMQKRKEFFDKEKKL